MYLIRLTRWLWLLVLLAACGATPSAERAAPTAPDSAAPMPTLNQPTTPSVAPTASSAPAPTAAPAPTVAPLPDGPLAPELAGGAWVNSPPLTLAGLRGSVVLVDFWTSNCYNCRNTLPAMQTWWSKYKDQGLVIIGVHTPEFASEHELANVQAAVKSQEISWPVVQDNDYKTWQAFGNHYWPHFYLIDHRGQIIYDHIGEGAYEETDQQIAAALLRAKTQP